MISLAHERSDIDVRRIIGALGAATRGVKTVNNKIKWVWEFGALVLLIVLFLIMFW